MIISFRTLDSDVDDSIRKALTPEAHLAKLSASIKEGTKKDTKLVLIVCAFVAVMLGGILGLVLFQNPSMSEAILAWIGGYVVFVGIISFLVYLANVGLIRFQFNSALKEGYPELYKKYKV